MYFYESGAAPFQQGEYFTSDLQITWSGTEAFNLAALSGQSLYAYWGTNLAGEAATGVLQATAPAVEGGTSAVPEPSTYAMLAGQGALGLAVWRRRSVSAVAAA